MALGVRTSTNRPSANMALKNITRPMFSPSSPRPLIRPAASLCSTKDVGFRVWCRPGAVDYFWLYRTGAIQDRGYAVPRTHLTRTWVNSASTKVGYTESLASRKEISVRQEQVAEVMNDALSQELLHSAIPARIAYNGTDGFPRAIPIGFLWKDGRIVVCTASNAYKVKALEARPEVALTIDTDSQPYRALLVRGTASVEIVDGVPSEYLEASRKAMKDEEQFRAFEAEVRSLYERMARISITPEWAKVLDFQTRLPSAVEQLVNRKLVNPDDSSGGWMG